MLNTRGNKITWLGHSAFRFTTAEGKVLLVDPFLTGNPLCPEKEKRQPRVDAILLSHAHGDHVGDTLELARQHKPAIVCIYELSLLLESKGAQNVMGMSKGGSAKVAGCEVSLTHAFHSSSLQDGGKITYAGEPAGIVLTLPGGLVVYHAGDTCVFGDMKLIAEIYRPEVACLPIGDFYTMGPREAAAAIRLLGVKHVLPMHYGTFPPLTGRPSHVRELTKDIAGLEIHEPSPAKCSGSPAPKNSHPPCRGGFTPPCAAGCRADPSLHSRLQRIERAHVENEGHHPSRSGKISL